MRRFLLALALLFAFPLAAQTPAEEARRSVTAIEALLQQRPEDGTLWFFLSRAQVRAGEPNAAIRSMEQAAKYGDGFLPTREDFAPIWDHAEFRALRDRMEAKLPRLDYAGVAFTLEDRTLIPEGIAYDAPSRSFFVGSILQHKVMRVQEDGAVGDFVGLGGDLDAVLGLAVDSPRRVLYVVSTTALTT